MSINTLYSSFTDPHLKHYYEDERRLKQLRTFGLINKNNEVYPERVYQTKIVQADRKEALAQSKFQKEVREALHKQHIKLHKQWNEKGNERHNRVASAKTQPSKPTRSNIRLPDFEKWTRKDFIKYGFDYYPDYCRPQTAPSTQWHKLRGSHSATRPNTSDESPYRNWPPKFQARSIKKHKNNRNSHKESSQEQPDGINKNGDKSMLLNSSSNKVSDEKLPTIPFEQEKQNESGSKNLVSEQNAQEKQHPGTPFRSTANRHISTINLTKKFTALTRSLSSPSIQVHTRGARNIMQIFRSPKPLDLLDNDF